MAIHSRARQPGERITHHDHLPEHKLQGLLWNSEMALEVAAKIGPATQTTVERLLDDRVVDPLPKARRLLALVDIYGSARLEAACQRALAHEDPAYMTVKRILAQRLDEQPPAELILLNNQEALFARADDDLFGVQLAEVQLWH